MIGSVLTLPAQAACQGEGLIDTIKDGIEQAWGSLKGSPGEANSILCPEVTAPLPAAPRQAPLARPMPPPSPPDLNTDGDGDGVSDGQDWCQTTPAGARVDARGCDLIPERVVSLPDRQFESDKDTLNPTLQNELEKLAGRIKATPGREKLRVIGHADSKGKESYNDDLSLRRAWGVADFLSSKGVSLEMIDYAGKGESMPVADNRYRKGRAANRRVVITVD